MFNAFLYARCSFRYFLCFFFLFFFLDIFFETLNVKMDEGLTIYDKFCSNKSRKAKQRPLQQLAQKGQELVNNRQISLFLLRLSTQDQRRALFFFFFSFILFLIILPSLKLWNLSPTQCKGCFFLVFDFSISFFFFVWLPRACLCLHSLVVSQ